MTHPKSLEEFIEKQYPGRVTMFIDQSAQPFLGADEVWELRENVRLKDGHTSTEVENKYLREAAKRTAAEILRVCEEWCKADPESSFHPNLSSWRLYDYLKSYINSTNTEGGDE